MDQADEISLGRPGAEPTTMAPMPSILRGADRLAHPATTGIDPSFNTSVTEGNGFVYETAIQPDGKIIAVGSFHMANGNRVNGVARFNADGSYDQTFVTGDGANATVYAVELQSDGKVLIGGDLTTFDGQAVPRIARLNTDGSLDTSFTSGVAFNSTVWDIAIQTDGKILVGGAFTSSGSRLVRLNSDGSLDITFARTVAVRSVIIDPSGRVITGGTRGVNAPAIQRFTAAGAVDATFDPGAGPDSDVGELVLQPDGKIVASGVFRTYNGTASVALVRINDNGTLHTSFDYVPSSPFVLSNFPSLAVQPDGKILFGFVYPGFTSKESNVIRFNADGSLDDSFIEGNSDVYDVFDLRVLSDGKILAAGFFVEYNNQTRLRIVRLNSDGSVDGSFAAAVSAMATVSVIRQQNDGKIIIGGDFDFVNGIRTRGGIARVNPNGSVDGSFNLEPELYADSHTFSLQPDGKIMLGGSYVLVRLNSDGSRDDMFTLQIGDYFPYPVTSIGFQTDGKIVVGGSLSGPLGNVAALRYHPNGNFDSTFAVLRMTGAVRALSVQPDDKIVLGGTFTPSTDLPRAVIARLNADGTLADGFNAANGLVYSLAESSNGQVLAGGGSLDRYTLEGAPDPTLNVGTGFSELVRSVAGLSDGKILVGGHFTTYNGTLVNRLIRLNASGTLDPTFDIGSGPDGTVRAVMQQTDGKLLIGGTFMGFDGTAKFGIVRLLTAPAIKAPFDFDGDGKTDVAIYRPAGTGGEWWWNRSSDSTVQATQFGLASDVIAPGDFTGDGKMDIAFFRPSTGFWNVLRSEDSTYYAFPFGTDGDVPVTGDYDGDGKADVAVFRPSNSTWYIARTTDGGTTIAQFGIAGDQPVTADYDGDGKDDIGVYRPGGQFGGEWWINRSTAGLLAMQFGSSTDKTVPADYTGDGKADVAFWRPSTGEWFIIRSEDSSYYAVPFGASGDLPTPGDYDGDGKADLAVFRPSQGTWFIAGSTSGTQIVGFGLNGDRPVPNSFVR